MDDQTPSASSWERVEEIFTAACEIPDEAERAVYVRRACAGDEDLRVEIERLLAVRDGDSQFLEPPPLVVADLVGRVIDDFEVVEEIGRGGMGIVYRARQRSLGREVALKVLPLVLRGNDAVSERFRREAIAASKLRHPGIATVLAFGEVDGTFYYSMELVAGTNLRDAMDRTFRGERAEHDPDLTDPKVCADLVRQMAEALHFAHEAGVVHRDVKPHNILIEHDGRTRLIDFGLAKLLDMRGVTLTGDVNGTPHYMSPEQADATRRDVDRRADVYSLGAVLYELLSKRTPFIGSSSYEVLYRIANDEPKPLRKVAPDAPRELEVLCERALERDPDDRLASAEALADELARFGAGRPIHTAPRSAAQRVQRTVVRGRRGILIAGVSAVVVAAAASVTWMVVDTPEPTYRVVLRGDEGVRYEATVVRSVVGTEAAEVIASFAFVGSTTVRLPLGVHQIELTDNASSWKRTAFSREVDDEQLIVLGNFVDTPDSDLAHVPAQSVTVRNIFKDPGPYNLAHELATAETRPFLVDPELLSFSEVLEAIEVIEGFEAAREFRDRLRRKFEDDPDFDEERLLSLPATYIHFARAQNCLAYYGLRLPTMAEAVALARGGEDWLVGPVTDLEQTPLVVGRTDVEGTSPGLDDHYRHAEPVSDGEPIGPLGIHHPLGNVAIWASTPGFVRNAEGHVVGTLAPTVYGARWSDERCPESFDDELLHSGGFLGGEFVTNGLRGVRSVP